MIKKNKFLFLLCGTFLLIAFLFFSLKKDKEKGFFLSREIDSYELYTHKGTLLKEKKVLNKPSIFFLVF